MAYINSVRFKNDFYCDVVQGKIAGHSIVDKFGHGLIGTDLVPVTSTLTWQTPTVDTALELVTTSANDTATGSGARLVEVQGYVKATGVLTSVNVIPNGLTPVALSTDLFRVRRITVLESGTYANATAPSHSGDIIVRTAGGGAEWGRIVNDGGFGFGQSQIGADMIPGGKTGYVIDGYINVETSKTVDAYLFQRQGANVTSAPYKPMRIIAEAHGLGGNTSLRFAAPLGPFPEFTDIGIMAQVSTGTASVAVKFQLLLIDN